ncbi:DUF6678 family protein [Thalassomonas sp. RHCl1]|uniref:DUF6678 family protein n=1 Tax=Thalassomonas sp. RHCl1 TaxID=2995320 RepID=UPI00248BA3BB|nr:DUF6678 family protein [Thalassomonas sp. RHCl1]
MNDTKWRELQTAMYELKPNIPFWRTRCVDNGYETPNWDGDWIHHFYAGGFETIEWVEIQTTDDKQRSIVRSVLKKIHVPGHETEHGFKVYGYIRDGAAIDYI